MTASDDPPHVRPATSLLRGKTLFWIVAAAGASLDWWTKGFAFDWHLREMGLLHTHHPVQLFDLGFARIGIVREFNPGIAFGWLSDLPNSYLYLSAVRVLALAFLLRLLRRIPAHATTRKWSLGCLAGGAMGNLLDNLFQNEPLHEHAVRDFLYVAVGDGKFPALNLADILVGVGAIVLIAAILYRSALPLLRRSPQP